jgi:hypothetical protein
VKGLVKNHKRNTSLERMNKKGTLPVYIPVLVAVFISSFYFLFHFHFMQQFIDWDQVWYANNTINMLNGSMPYYNPHHIHQETTSMLFHKFMVSYFGEAGFTDIAFNIRLRALLFSCVGILFLILYLKDITGKLMWGVLGGLIVAFCHGYLAYSTQMDTGIYPSAVLCMILWLLRKIETAKQGSLIYSCIGGIIIGLGVVFHQYMAITCVTAVVSLAIPRLFFFRIETGKLFKPFQIERKTDQPQIDRSPKKWYMAVVMMAFVGMVLIGGVYFYTGKSVFNLPFDKPDRKTARGRYSYTIFQKWLFLYQDEGWWARGFTKFNPKHSFRGFTNAFLSPTTPYKYLRYGKLDFNYHITRPFDEKPFAFNQVAFFTLIPFIGSIIIFPIMWRRYRGNFFFIISSFAGLTFFTTYWEPRYFEFWVSPSILSCVLAILFLNRIGEMLGRMMGRAGQFPFYAAAFIFLFSLVSHNTLYYVIPYSRYRHMEDIDYKWKREYYMDLFSTSVYRYPLNPYGRLYKIHPIR